MALRWQEQNLYQTSNSQQTPLSSPSRASHGVSIVRILEKFDRVLTAPHCINIRRDTLLQINIQNTRGDVNQCRYAASRNPMYLYLYNIISKYDPTCTYVTPEGYGYNERKKSYSLLWFVTLSALCKKESWKIFTLVSILYLVIIRKSRDYIYGKWKYPVLIIKRLFRVKPYETKNKGKSTIIIEIHTSSWRKCSSKCRLQNSDNFT